MFWFLAVIGGAVGFVALAVGGYLWRGFVLAQLWGWFMVPIFGLPKLSIAAAIGISVVIGFLTYQVAEDTEKPHRSQVEIWTRTVLLTALLPALSLLTGWIVHGFMPQ